MEIGHRLHQAGVEFSQAQALAKRPDGAPAAVAAALHHAQVHLPIVAAIAEEIASRRLALHEADLRHIARNGQVIMVRPEYAGPHGIDDPQRGQAHLGRDAPISHPHQPAAGFLLEGLV
jgi:hypothetical protein